MSANWLDQAIAFLSPGAGKNRLRARLQYEAFRAYAGAAAGMHTDGWRTSPTSADAEIAIAGPKLRERMRDLVRNNPHAGKAVSIWATDIVGDGIVPRAAFVDAQGNPDEARNKKVDDAFKRWCDESDADGQLDFYGQQTLAVREMVEGGEVLARRRWRKYTDGYHVPVQVQLLEPDFLDDGKNGPLASGNNSISGIEFDLIGQRQAYWLYKQHPGNSFITTSMLQSGFRSAPVPASEIAHLYEKQRTQARGVPWGSAIIRRQRDADDYDFSEGIRKKIESSVVAFVIGDEQSQEGINPDGTLAGDVTRTCATDARGNVLEKIAPGLIAYLRGGKDVKFNAPASVGGYGEYKKISAREVAAGWRIPYEYLTGDLSEVNFSSARVGLVAYRRHVSQVQYQIVIPMLLSPVWRWFCEAAYLAGHIDTADVPVEWSPPKWEAIEPYKDALADLITLRTGTRSYPDMAAARGRKWSEIVKEIAAWNKALDADGITLDSDPRRTSLKGVVQKLLPGQDGQGDGQPGDGQNQNDAGYVG